MHTVTPIASIYWMLARRRILEKSCRDTAERVCVLARPLSLRGRCFGGSRSSAASPPFRCCYRRRATQRTDGCLTSRQCGARAGTAGAWKPVPESEITEGRRSADGVFCFISQRILSQFSVECSHPFDSRGRRHQRYAQHESKAAYPQNVPKELSAQ